MRITRIVFLCGLLVVGIILTGCGSPEATESAEITEPAEITEEGDIAKVEVKASIAGWIPGNADNISQTIGALVTADTPIAKEIAAKVVKTVLLTELELSVDHTKPIDGEDRYSARVTLGFPILLEIPVLGEKEYWVTVSYDFTIEDGQVVDADIDASSFEMKESNS